MTGKKSPLRGKFRGLITAIYNRHCVRSNLDFTLRRVGCGDGSEIEMTEYASAFGKTAWKAAFCVFHDTRVALVGGILCIEILIGERCGINLKSSFWWKVAAGILLFNRIEGIDEIFSCLYWD